MAEVETERKTGGDGGGGGGGGGDSRGRVTDGVKSVLVSSTLLSATENHRPAGC